MNYPKSYFGLEGISLNLLNTPASWTSYIIWEMVKGDEKKFKSMQTIFTYPQSCPFE